MMSLRRTLLRRLSSSGEERFSNLGTGPSTVRQ